jgi:RNA polymerase sigma factor (sigma-70 family)
MYEELSDAEVLRLSRDEPEAFGAFYQRHAETVLRYFARRTLDPEAAPELTAETFAQAFASRRRFRDQEGRGGLVWLYGIGRNLLSRYFRTGAVDARARRRLGVPEREISEQDYERIEELIDFEQVGRAIASAFSVLSEEQRDALTLRVVEGRPYNEVAEHLSCTEETARARVSRGLRRLARVLDVPQPETELGG